MQIRKDWTTVPTILALLLCTWTLIMCIFVFWGPDGWAIRLYDTLAVFISIICIYEVLTGTIQKAVTAHLSSTTPARVTRTLSK